MVSNSYIFFLIVVSLLGIGFGSVMLMRRTIRGRYAGIYLLSAAAWPALMLVTSVEGPLLSHLRFETPLVFGIIAWILMWTSAYLLLVTLLVLARPILLARHTPRHKKIRFGRS